jgi:hypothetical protein
MKRWTTMALVLALMGVGLVACSGESAAYKEACAANSADAYRGYLEQFPEGLSSGDVKHRLDLVEYEAAEKAGTVEAYDAYMEAHPDGRFAETAREEARKLAWAAAEDANTVDAMVEFKNKYGTGAMGITTDKRLEALRYAATSVKIEELVVERINISGDRRAEPNGHVIRAKFTNSGERSAKVMKLRVVFKDEDGGAVDSRTEFIATPSHPMGIPIPERLQAPFAPGEERMFEYLIGDDTAKPGWKADAEHLTVEVTEIDFAEG